MFFKEFICFKLQLKLFLLSLFFKIITIKATIILDMHLIYVTKKTLKLKRHNEHTGHYKKVILYIFGNGKPLHCSLTCNQGHESKKLQVYYLFF
jgi:hypothetical protein